MKKKKCVGLTIIQIRTQFNLEELILIDALRTRFEGGFFSLFLFRHIRTNVINDDIKECGL